MDYKITTKVRTGDTCWAKNYRARYLPWEEGECTSVEAHLYSNGKVHVSYTVVLKRRNILRSGELGRPIRLYVNDTSVSREKP